MVYATLVIHLFMILLLLAVAKHIFKGSQTFNIQEEYFFVVADMCTLYILLYIIVKRSFQVYLEFLKTHSLITCSCVSYHVVIATIVGLKWIINIFFKFMTIEMCQLLKTLAVDTLVCGWEFETTKHNTMYIVPMKHVFKERSLQNYQKILKKCLIVSDNRVQIMNKCLYGICHKNVSKEPLRSAMFITRSTRVTLRYCQLQNDGHMAQLCVVNLKLPVYNYSFNDKDLFYVDINLYIDICCLL